MADAQDGWGAVYAGGLGLSGKLQGLGKDAGLVQARLYILVCLR